MRGARGGRYFKYRPPLVSSVMPFRGAPGRRRALAVRSLQPLPREHREPRRLASSRRHASSCAWCGVGDSRRRSKGSTQSRRDGRHGRRGCVVSSWTDAMGRGGQVDLHGIRPAAAPAAVARSRSHPLCWSEGRRRTGSGAHATLKSDHGGTRDVKDLTINPFEAADGGEGARRCVGSDEVVQPSKGGTNGGRRPGIGSCIRNPSHLYKSCSSNKPLPISVRKLGSKMQVSRDLELQSSTKIWLLLKIQWNLESEYTKTERFLASACP